MIRVESNADLIVKENKEEFRTGPGKVVSGSAAEGSMGSLIVPRSRKSLTITVKLFLLYCYLYEGLIPAEYAGAAGL